MILELIVLIPYLFPSDNYEGFILEKKLLASATSGIFGIDDNRQSLMINFFSSMNVTSITVSFESMSKDWLNR